MRREEIDQLRELHRLARNAQLGEENTPRYRELVPRLLFAALASQNAAAGARQRPRGGARSRRAVPVELGWDGNVHRGVTLDFGAGGFAALLGASPPRDLAVDVVLHLSRNERLFVRARLVAARERRGTARASFAFEDLGAEERERLEHYLVDDALAEVSFAERRDG